MAEKAVRAMMFRWNIAPCPFDRRWIEELSYEIQVGARLTDPEGRRVVKDGGSSAFSLTEARRFLVALPDRSREWFKAET
jgi:hypothetical protein